jgi:hypothetical protein
MEEEVFRKQLLEFLALKGNAFNLDNFNIDIKISKIDEKGGGVRVNDKDVNNNGGGGERKEENAKSEILERNEPRAGGEGVETVEKMVEERIEKNVEEVKENKPESTLEPSPNTPIHDPLPATPHSPNPSTHSLYPLPHPSSALTLHSTQEQGEDTTPISTLLHAYNILLHRVMGTVPRPITHPLDNIDLSNIHSTDNNRQWKSEHTSIIQYGERIVRSASSRAVIMVGEENNKVMLSKFKSLGLSKLQSCQAYPSNSDSIEPLLQNFELSTAPKLSQEPMMQNCQTLSSPAEEEGTFRKKDLLSTNIDLDARLQELQEEKFFDQADEDSEYNCKKKTKISHLLQSQQTEGLEGLSLMDLLENEKAKDDSLAYANRLALLGSSDVGKVLI